MNTEKLAVLSRGAFEGQTGVAKRATTNWKRSLEGARPVEQIKEGNGRPMVSINKNNKTDRSISLGKRLYLRMRAAISIMGHSYRAPSNLS